MNKYTLNKYALSVSVLSILLLSGCGLPSTIALPDELQEEILTSEAYMGESSKIVQTTIDESKLSNFRDNGNYGLAGAITNLI